jgi:hypothetical protein
MDKEYIVVQSANCDTLEDRVDELIKKGYGVYGPVQILVHKEEITWVQVLLKLHKQNVNPFVLRGDPSNLRRN